MWETVDIFVKPYEQVNSNVQVSRLRTCIVSSGDGGRMRHPHIAMHQSQEIQDYHSMLSQRLWVNIENALGECHVFADVLAQSIQQTQCWISVGPVS